MFTSRHPQICRQIDRFVRTCFIWTPCWVPLLGALLGTEPSTSPPPQRLMQWALGPHGQRSRAMAGSEPLMLWSLPGSRCWSLEVGSRWYICELFDHVDYVDYVDLKLIYVNLISWSPMGSLRCFFCLYVYFTFRLPRRSVESHLEWSAEDGWRLTQLQIFLFGGALCIRTIQSHQRQSVDVR
jgi:hypothetical protein